MRHIDTVFGGKAKGGFGKWLAGFALLFLVGMALKSDATKAQMPLSAAFRQELAGEVADAVYIRFMPGVAAFSGESCGEWMVHTQIQTILPLYGRAMREREHEGQERVIREDDGHSKVVTYEELTDGEQGENTGAKEPVQDQSQPLSEADWQALLQEENQLAYLAAAKFVPHEQKLQLNREEFADYESLVKTFYTIDANTMAGSDQLNLDALLGQDMTLDPGGEDPQILIYHTHSQEAFADSVPGNTGTTIVGVGERLAQILREDYGYTVLHHTGQYDVDTRDDAYGKSLPALEEILAEYPSIQVVIDLHRDQMAEETRLVMNLDGRPTARFMFFNGLSRTKKSGNISYLKNDNIKGNLAFAFQMQLKCAEYYPGLTRKIYLKGYRYNMHLRPRTLLVELGAQNNTVEEAMNACDPLAHVLDMVLSGK